MMSGSTMASSTAAAAKSSSAAAPGDNMAQILGVIAGVGVAAVGML